MRALFILFFPALNLQMFEDIMFGTVAAICDDELTNLRNQVFTLRRAEQKDTKSLSLWWYYWTLRPNPWTIYFQTSCFVKHLNTFFCLSLCLSGALFFLVKSIPNGYRSKPNLGIEYGIKATPYLTEFMQIHRGSQTSGCMLGSATGWEVRSSRGWHKQERQAGVRSQQQSKKAL